MEASLKKQSKSDRQQNANHVGAKKAVSNKKYLSSIKEYKPEKINGYTNAF